MKIKIFHLLHLFVGSLFVRVHSLYGMMSTLTLFVVVQSLYLIDVYFSWNKLPVFTVFVVLNRDKNDELVDRQIPQNVVAFAVVTWLVKNYRLYAFIQRNIKMWNVVSGSVKKCDLFLKYIVLQFQFPKLLLLVTS